LSTKAATQLDATYRYCWRYTIPNKVATFTFPANASVSESWNLEAVSAVSDENHRETHSEIGRGASGTAASANTSGKSHLRDLNAGPTVYKTVALPLS
jgi:hypothetical protein